MYEDLPPVVREKRAVAHFINALTSPYAQHELHLSIPQTMEQAFEIAATRETAIGREDLVFNRQSHSLLRTPVEPKTINNNYDHNVRKPEAADHSETPRGSGTENKCKPENTLGLDKEATALPTTIPNQQPHKTRLLQH